MKHAVILLLLAVACANRFKHNCKWVVFDLSGAVDNYGIYEMKCNHNYTATHSTLLYSLKIGDTIPMELTITTN